MMVSFSMDETEEMERSGVLTIGGTRSDCDNAQERYRQANETSMIKYHHRELLGKSCAKELSAARRGLSMGNVSISKKTARINNNKKLISKYQNMDEGIPGVQFEILKEPLVGTKPPLLRPDLNNVKEWRKLVSQVIRIERPQRGQVQVYAIPYANRFGHYHIGKKGGDALNKLRHVKTKIVSSDTDQHFDGSKPMLPVVINTDDYYQIDDRPFLSDLRDCIDEYKLLIPHHICAPGLKRSKLRDVLVFNTGANGQIKTWRDMPYGRMPGFLPNKSSAELKLWMAKISSICTSRLEKAIALKHSDFSMYAINEGLSSELTEYTNTLVPNGYDFNGKISAIAETFSLCSAAFPCTYTLTGKCKAHNCKGIDTDWNNWEASNEIEINERPKKVAKKMPSDCHKFLGYHVDESNDWRHGGEYISTATATIPIAEISKASKNCLLAHGHKGDTLSMTSIFYTRKVTSSCLEKRNVIAEEGSSGAKMICEYDADDSQHLSYKICS